MPGESSFSFTVAKGEKAMRLDAWVAGRIQGITRAQARRMISRGEICVGDSIRKPAYPVKAGDRISGRIPQPQPILPGPEPRPLDILYEDESLIVLNKPPGMVVHPAPGHFSGTLVHALLYRFPELENVGDPSRPGIVHRIDKDTSGLLLVARTPEAFSHLVRQFQSRRIIKTYLAMVWGVPASQAGEISLPIGRHPRDRKRMSTLNPRGREAMTEWSIRERFEKAALLEIGLKTGRTHQIRVHCAALGCPVMGDALYGKRTRQGKAGPFKSGIVSSAERQMLHAWRVTLQHPPDAGPIHFEAPLPKDMKDMIEAFRKVSGG